MRERFCGKLMVIFEYPEEEQSDFQDLFNRIPLCLVGSFAGKNSSFLEIQNKRSGFSVFEGDSYL
jgi:hypothetical protein